MKINKNNFPSIISDNEETYFRHLEGIIASLDKYAAISLTRKPEGISVRITPSDYPSLTSILSQVKKVNTLFGIEVEFSKSIKSSNIICYNININNSD
jgi:hypothetical protein